MNVTEGALVERLPIATFVIDRDHRIAHWNDALADLTGVPAAAMIGTRDQWAPFYPYERPLMADLVVAGACQADIEAYYPDQSVRAVFQGGYEAEDYFPDLGKGPRWLHFTAVPLLDSDGVCAGAIQTLVDVTGRRAMETERLASQRQLTEIIEGNPVPTFVIDADHRVTHWNRACEVVMGIPAATMIGTKDQWRAFYPEPRPVMADLILARSKGAEYQKYYKHYRESSFIDGAFEAEGFFPHFPRGGRWLAFTAAPLHGVDGAIIGAIETLQDTTERKRAEVAYAESQRQLAEEKYRVLFDEMINALAVYEIVADDAGCPIDFRYLIVNPAFEAMTGLSGDGLQGRTFREINPPGIVSRVFERFARVALTGQPDSFEISTQGDGHHFDIRAFRPTEGELAVTVQDVSARRQAEVRLQLLASVFEHTQEGIIITNPDSEMIEVNDSFLRISGYSREELIGRRPNLLQSGQHGPEFYNAMWMALMEEGLWRGEVWNRRKTGEIYPQHLTISAVLDEHGHPSHYVGVVVDITAIKRHEAELDRIAHYDSLTGLPNRVLLNDRFRLAIAKARREHTRLAVCFLDVDGFKPVNDSYGHGAGDMLLIELAERFLLELRGDDTVARLGGDEFIILLADLRTEDDCIQILDRILATVSRPFAVAGHPVSVTASIGVTLFPTRATDIDTLMRQADQAMYKSKQTGKNSYFFYDDNQDAVAIEHHRMVHRFRQALAERELVLHYQPKVNMRSGRIMGAEALIRWHHPERGLLPPGEFLPAIENDAVIEDLGDWVVGEALRQVATWERAGLTVPISVNISPRHLQSPRFVERLERHLRDAGRLHQSCLEIEITETAAIHDLRHITRLIEECRALGVPSALDDFGTGYSSLTYLKLLPVHTLKIDKSFILDMARDAEDHAIVSGVIGLARAFDLIVIAEGVETTDHGLLLLALGCDFAQGYGIAPPMAADRFLEWARHWRPDPHWAAAGPGIAPADAFRMKGR
ncbi:EAL domain-containing protein [Roseospira marina]|nr:EAL domain-containing protein [Roseospira marina]MBB4313072.1 diguanylate cyclase (GGDEF)-like protein/PAS domain S-box-containing protein [Roseospira marina]MBB5086187.1 diguanylate cyclase (GGDEF)-like protein/PAS domain S-box-containing protein [Roseospira marina]